MNLKIISRGKGKSAVEAAAYRATEKITSEYDGLLHDYTAKKGLVCSNILLPENAPSEYYDRSILWNAVEKSERAKNAQLAREVRLVLPIELTMEQNINLAHQYVQETFVDKGMCADICIHDTGEGNPHAHVMLTMRPLEQDGSWSAKSKMEYVLDAHGERIKLPSGRPKTKRINTTNWDDRANADIWREAWAKNMNMYLEYYGHEARVDHRSYERQGVEQIPTIHLGVVAHGLEKKGIKTERGNINRAIKKANERLKNINKEIHKIQNPPKPKLLIDLENSIKAKDSPGYAHWASIFNLQQMAQTLLYIQENGYTDMKSLQTAHQATHNDHAEIKKTLDENRAEVKALTAQKKQAENYRNTLDVYKEWTKPGWIPYFKNQFYEKHKADIEAHKKAKAYLFEELKLEKFPSLKRLSGEISDLTASQKSLQQDLKAAQEKLTAISTAQHNARMLLGYKELEEANDYTPTMPQAEKLRYTKPYEETFVKAKKQGETARYFNSLLADIECAKAIRNKLSEGRPEEKVAKGILKTYGKERAEKVMAAFANKNLAANSNPAFQYAPPDSFVRIFKETADSMVLTTNPQYGWALPEEIAERKREAQLWDVGLSYAERWARAEQKVKEQDSNRPPPQKRGRSSEMEW